MKIIWTLIIWVAAAVPAQAIMDGQGRDIFPQTAIFYSSATVLDARGIGAAQVRLADNVAVSSETSAALGAGVRVSSNVYIVGFSSAAKYYGDGSGLTNVSGTDSNRVAKAGDTMSGALTLSGDPSSALHAATKQYVDTGGSACPTGMAYIPGFYPFCIDKYEAYLVSGSVSNDTCTDGTQAQVDANNTTAVAGSAAGQTPLVNINWCAAKKACQNAGKHLLTNSEWFNAANYKGSKWNITTEETAEAMSCNTASECGAAACTSGASAGCVTQEGVYDMIGNVWEWVDFVMTADPTNGVAQNFVTGYDFATGIPTASGASSPAFGGDYYWSYDGAGAARAVFRGGSWADGVTAGVFAFAAFSAPSASATAIGFRCGRRR